jgi:putative CocE/NonD family hydrolase
MAEGLRQSLAWHNAHLRGDRSGLREAPVRAFVIGADEWRDFPEWPPPGFQPERWHLQPDGGLATETPPQSDPGRYRYDPADPTPNLAGTVLAGQWGQRDNRKLESRPDVLVYTSKPLDQDLEVIGPVEAELFVRSSLEHTDFFTRLCDVDPKGKSLNVCDGLQRLRPNRPEPEPDGCIRVGNELWPIASAASTASGSRSPAVPIPASPATLAAASRWPPRRRCVSPTRRCTTTRPTPPRSSFQS